MKTNYLFDPLCGWCYAVSPALTKLAEIADINAIPTGLFSNTRRVMDAQFATHAWANDTRIRQKTGLEFSEKYRQNVLEKPTNFDSFNLVLALTAVQNHAPNQELSVLRLLQNSRYVDGLDTAELGVLTSILNNNGFGEISERLTDENPNKQNLVKQANERILHGAKTAQTLGVKGVPQLFVEKENGWVHIPSEWLFDLDSVCEKVQSL